MHACQRSSRFLREPRFGRAAGKPLHCLSSICRIDLFEDAQGPLGATGILISDHAATVQPIQQFFETLARFQGRLAPERPLHGLFGELADPGEFHHGLLSYREFRIVQIANEAVKPGCINLDRRDMLLDPGHRLRGCSGQRPSTACNKRAIVLLPAATLLPIPMTYGTRACMCPRKVSVTTRRSRVAENRRFSSRVRGR